MGEIGEKWQKRFSVRTSESFAADAQEQGACIRGGEGLRIPQMDPLAAAAACAGTGPLFKAPPSLSSRSHHAAPDSIADLGAAELAEALADRPGGGVHGLGARALVGAREVEVAQIVYRNEMQVHVRHLETGDHEPHPGR